MLLLSIGCGGGGDDSATAAPAPSGPKPGIMGIAALPRLIPVPVGADGAARLSEAFELS